MLTARTVIIIATVASAHDINGVGPDFLSKYQEHVTDWDASNLTCFADPTRTGLLNDNFCDCPDGSDEPGTSACAGIHPLRNQRSVLLDSSFNLNFSFIDSQGIQWSKKDIEYREGARNLQAPPGFYCPQNGFFPKYVPAWSVRDNICDCCDGSDEYPLHKNCPNTCDQDAAQWSTDKFRVLQEANYLQQISLEKRKKGQIKLQGWIDDIEQSRDVIQGLEHEIAEAELKMNAFKIVEVSQDNQKNTTPQDDCSDSPCDSMNDSHQEENEKDLDKEDVSEYAKWMAKDNVSTKPAEKDPEFSKTDPTQDIVSPSPSTDIQNSWEIKSGLLAGAWNTLSHLWQSVSQRMVRRKTESPVSTDMTSGQENPWIVILEDKKQQLRNKEEARDEAVNALQNTLFLSNPSFISLYGRSFRLNVGERVIDVAIDGSASEQEGWYGRKLDLGSHVELVHLDTIEPAWREIRPSRYQDVLSNMALWFRGGSPCTTSDHDKEGNTNAILVFLVCGNDDALLLKEEPIPCKHVGVLSTPIVCDGQLLSDPQPSQRDGAPRRKRMGGDSASVANIQREEL